MKEKTLSEKRIDTFKNLDEVNVKNLYFGCDVKEAVSKVEKRLKEASENNDWEVAVNDGEEEGFRIVSGIAFIEQIFLEEFGEF